MVVPLTREWARVVETPFVRWLRRRFPKHAKRLVQYRTVHTGRFCIGVWQCKDAGLVDELHNWDLDEPPTPGAVRLIGYMLGLEVKRDRKLAVRRKLGARKARVAKAENSTRERNEIRRRRTVGRVQIMVPGCRS